MKDTLAALREACDAAGIPYTKQTRKAQLRDMLDAQQPATPPAALPGLGGEPAPNGFLLVKVKLQDGSDGVNIQAIGDATMYEAPGVIGAALREVKAHFGL